MRGEELAEICVSYIHTENTMTFYVNPIESCTRKK